MKYKIDQEFTCRQTGDTYKIRDTRETVLKEYKVTFGVDESVAWFPEIVIDGDERLIDA